ncbi:MAG TPA: protein-disulfide reductase DsbD family protein [Saprospiraceae bacterium]|nr:protein-disulfide reductase DsbD family protein [Saprospiraceae bacterium]HMP23830.1 protein-disulfide reductase DsbD family protein [Saprospiraceae bacterium]
MKITNTFLFLLMVTAGALAQSSPVKWSFAAKKINASEYELVLTAQMAKGWYVYSQYLESDAGPIPTSFTFAVNDDFELVGQTREEGDRKEGYDEIFGMNLIKFAGKADFVQPIRLQRKMHQVSGTLEFMTCDDEQCLPPRTIDFTIDLQ